MAICPACQEDHLFCDSVDGDTLVFYCSPCDIEFHAELVPDIKNAKRIYNWSKTEEGKRICSD